MDGHHRKKFFKMLAQIATDPEKFSLAVKFFCQQNTKETNVQENPGAKGRIASHWIIGVIAGAGMSYQGSYDTLVRYGVLIALFVWLVVESWMVLWNEAKGRLLSGILTGIAIVFFAGFGYLIHVSHLKFEQDDVLSKMVLTVSQPRDNNARALMVSVINNGGTTISRHEIECEWVYAHFKSGQEVKHSSSSVQPPAQTLGAYGGSDSSPCMQPMVIGGLDDHLFCADFIAQVTYELETQPGVKWFRRTRYWMRPSGDLYPMPLESAGYFCQ